MLQGQIDWLLSDLHQLVAIRTGKMSRTEKLNALNLGEIIANYPFRFDDSAKFLRENGVLTDKEYGALKQFYGLRNRLVHRLIVRSYQQVTGKDFSNRNDVTRAEAKEGFENGRALAQLLKSKTARNLPFHKSG